MRDAILKFSDLYRQYGFCIIKIVLHFVELFSFHIK